MKTVDNYRSFRFKSFEIVICARLIFCLPQFGQLNAIRSNGLLPENFVYVLLPTEIPSPQLHGCIWSIYCIKISPPSYRPVDCFLPDGVGVERVYVLVDSKSDRASLRVVEKVTPRGAKPPQPLF